MQKHYQLIVCVDVGLSYILFEVIKNKESSKTDVNDSFIYLCLSYNLVRQ